MIKGFLFGAALTVAVAAFPFAAAHASTQKVTYCHVPAGNPGNAHTITTSIKAAMRPGHALIDVDGNVIEIGGHGGDYLGECKQTVKMSTVSFETTKDTSAPIETVTELPHTGSANPIIYALPASLFVGMVAELASRTKVDLSSRTA